MTHPYSQRPSLSLSACVVVAATLLGQAGPAMATEAELSAIIEDHWQWTLTQYPERRLDTASLGE